MDESEGKGISRRNFLKLSALATAGAVAAACQPKSTESIITPEKETKSSTAVLDFFGLESIEDRFIKENFPKDFSEQETLRDMGVEDSSTREGLLQAVPKDENQARLFMLKALEWHYGSHGEDVVAVMTRTAEEIDPEAAEKPSPEKVSITEAIRLGEIEFDEIGNPTMHLAVSGDVITKLVRRTGADLINMSFEPGQKSLTYTFYKKEPKYPEMARRGPSKRTVGDSISYKDYKGNEISKNEYSAIIEKMKETQVALLEPIDRDIVFLDGYAGAHTTENVLDLVEIAHSFSDKTFIAAGGNPTYLKGLQFPDIRQARELITEKGLWPNNLIVVGFEVAVSGYVGPASFGSDIYVSSADLEELGYFGASSYATPVIEEIVSQLKNSGDGNWKETLLETMTADREAWSGSDQIDYKLLDFQKVKDKL